MPRTSMLVLYGVSFVIHASLGVGVAEIEPAKEPERVAIRVVDVKKPKPKAEEPPPPPPPPVEAPKPVEAAKKKAPPKAKAEPAPAAAEAPPAAAAPPPAFGIAMTGTAGPGGISVPVGSADGVVGGTGTGKRVAEAKTLIEPKKPKGDGCDESASKPKPIVMSRPEYTEDARAAQIEGKVRIELTVDASGAVRNAKVLESLGHGLDEAALRAVQAATFEPAQQCGKPVSATFVVSIRFAL